MMWSSSPDSTPSRLDNKPASATTSGWVPTDDRLARNLVCALAAAGPAAEGVVDVIPLELSLAFLYSSLAVVCVLFTGSQLDVTCSSSPPNRHPWKSLVVLPYGMCPMRQNCYSAFSSDAAHGTAALRTCTIFTCTARCRMDTAVRPACCSRRGFTCFHAQRAVEANRAKKK